MGAACERLSYEALTGADRENRQVTRKCTDDNGQTCLVLTMARVVHRAGFPTTVMRNDEGADEVAQFDSASDVG